MTNRGRTYVYRWRDVLQRSSDVVACWSWTLVIRLECRCSNPSVTQWRHGWASLQSPCLGIVWHVIVCAANESLMTKHWQHACPERSDEKSLLEHGHDHLLRQFLCQTVPSDGPLLPSWTSALNLDPPHSNSVFSVFSLSQLAAIQGWHHWGRSPIVWLQLRCCSDDSANIGHANKKYPLQSLVDNASTV